VQDYPVRASHRGNLTPERLAELLRTHFDASEVSSDGAAASYGAISRIAASANGRSLRVDVTMNPQVPGEVQRETIARYNRFLEDATGYSAKERAKRLRKSASESAPGA
jgi:hypothetical protein